MWAVLCYHNTYWLKKTVLWPWNVGLAFVRDMVIIREGSRGGFCGFGEVPSSSVPVSLVNHSALCLLGSWSGWAADGSLKIRPIWLSLLLPCLHDSTKSSDYSTGHQAVGLGKEVKKCFVNSLLSEEMSAESGALFLKCTRVLKDLIGVNSWSRTKMVFPWGLMYSVKRPKQKCLCNDFLPKNSEHFKNSH